MRPTFNFAMVVLLMTVTTITCAAESLGAQIVLRLYRDFAWEAVLSQPGVPMFADQPKAILRRYLTNRLASALAIDSICKARQHEICHLDFMPLWASQDPTARDLAISQISRDEVRVEYTPTASQSKIVLLFRVEQTEVGWRVADIVYPSGRSLTKILAGVQE